ncbi:hypothetical protein [Psychromarinibacter sp. S121]|uniref:hypothetical protein n=1 Tax=Psychromarinibacter sp. S121 TaxID=3415127 RepID=UPI003C7B6359
MRMFLVLLAFLPASVLADGLDGRTLSFHIETWDDPDQPMFETTVLTAPVGPRVELDVETLGRKAGFDLIPLMVDADADSVTLDFSQTGPQEFYKARFNGYVIDFGDGCPVLTGARLDPEATTLPISGKRLRVEDGVLWVNVSGLETDWNQKAVIRLDLTPCTGG